MYLLKLLHSNFFKNQSKYYKGQKQCTYLHFSFKSSKLSLTCLSRRLQLLLKYNEIVFAESKVYFRPSNLPTTSTLIEFCLKNKKTNQNQSIKQKSKNPNPLTWCWNWKFYFIAERCVTAMRHSMDSISGGGGTNKWPVSRNQINFCYTHTIAHYFVCSSCY